MAVVALVLAYALLLAPFIVRVKVEQLSRVSTDLNINESIKRRHPTHVWNC